MPAGRDVPSSTVDQALHLPTKRLWWEVESPLRGCRIDFRRHRGQFIDSILRRIHGELQRMQALSHLVDLSDRREPVTGLLPHRGQLLHRPRRRPMDIADLIFGETQTRRDIEDRRTLSHVDIGIERVHLRMPRRESDHLDNPLSATSRNPVELDVKAGKIIKKDRCDLTRRHR
ncbi:hypothetical protein [Microbacterium sp.]|uniref:hypothetical protein n=1 Tax=Microbacterium sp. TaxID=51671 RepID=UPI0039E4D715